MKIKLFAFLLIAGLVAEAAIAFEIDFSRRRQKMSKEDAIPTMQDADLGMVGEFLGVTTPNREVVILNTDKGFVPATLRLEKNQKYTVHVVNVNEDKKNVSFVMDAYAQYHSTYFGKVKSFEIRPGADGVFSFQCPETSSSGKIVIYSGKKNPNQSEDDVQMRGIASEE